MTGKRLLARETKKRAKNEVTNFKECAARAFLILPDEDKDPAAETFSIMLDEDDEFVFRAIPFDSVPKKGAGSLLGRNFERVRVSKEMRKFFKEYAYVDEEGKLRDGAQYNNDASALTGMGDPLFGRAVFVKK